ncbi:acyltransferase family protein [Hufsiella ginkgonis]|uniref:Acyltransferase family protein n=1 Tax=Hufsiella ginkgonis TaxID=2695274 RepID=A0A7K1XX71_9SPHI|nr:acyltransferase [Hufsiella ginkgonis]MXV15116.1 acyltransferase family protein [Hufsiella ginkgonis]
MEKKNYAFVDRIRGISMFFIVFEHSSWCGELPQASQSVLTVYSLLIQFSKFGTICFFLLAGFLIGDKMFTYTPAQYFKRRVSTVAKPWFIWTLIFLFVLLLDEIPRYFRFHSDRMTAHFTETMAGHLKLIYFFSSYWFILNFIICIGILLLFKKHLYNIRLGLFLFLLTVFYCVNVYYEWVPPQHSVALFGFVFFLWLGAQLFNHWEKAEARARSIAIPVYLAAIALSLTGCLFEINHLRDMASTDPYNSLRVTSILFSMVMFFFLVRLRSISFIDKLKPRETTFGIYLIHFILVYSGLPLIFRPLKVNPENLTLLPLIGYQLIRFAIVYFTTLWLVKIINDSRYKWLIGR